MSSVQLVLRSYPSPSENRGGERQGPSPGPLPFIGLQRFSGHYRGLGLRVGGGDAKPGSPPAKPSFLAFPKLGGPAASPFLSLIIYNKELDEEKVGGGDDI